MMIGELLNQWGISGYLEWVTNLKEQYRVRRDWMVSLGTVRARER
jgi:aromatic amino acid aminotransferase I